MNSLTSVNNETQTYKTKSSSVTENGTAIIMPGEESNKDLFLKMLVAQMQNQDPFNPQDPTQYVTQLSQFTMLEQSMTLNDNMEYLMGMTNGLLVNSAMSGASNLIGKEVEVYAPVKSEDGESINGENTEDNQKTITGLVEGIQIKDGVVYMNIRDKETEELVSVEYAALIKVNKAGTDSDINTENKGE